MINLLLHRIDLFVFVNLSIKFLKKYRDLEAEENRNFDIEQPERDKLRAPRNTRDERAIKIGEALLGQKEKDDKQEGLPWRR